jgi:phage-related protein
VKAKPPPPKPLIWMGSSKKDLRALEVIESQAGNAYRAVYTVRFAAAVIVLHVFQKKSKSGVETPKPDMDLIEGRLKKAAELMKESKA